LAFKILFLAVLFPNTRAATIETVPAPTQLLHYDFESDSADSIRDQAGSFHGQPFNIRHRLGRVGRYAAGFEGSYIRVPGASTLLELAGSPYTVAWWIKFERPLIAATLTAQTPQPWGEIIYDLGPQEGPAGYGAQLLGNRIEGIHKSVSPPAITAVFDIFGLHSRWIHFTVTYDGEIRHLYVNGTEAASAPTPSAIVSSGTNDLFLGNSTEAIANGDLFGYAWTRNSFGGLLDEFRIYNYALTTNQISALVDVAPPLTITAASGRIGLAWPDTSEAIFTLEETTSLDADPEWTAVTPVPTPLNGLYQITLDSTGSSRFFRLKKKLAP